MPTVGSKSGSGGSKSTGQLRGRIPLVKILVQNWPISCTRDTHWWNHGASMRGILFPQLADLGRHKISLVETVPTTSWQPTSHLSLVETVLQSADHGLLRSHWWKRFAQSADYLHHILSSVKAVSKIKSAACQHLCGRKPGWKHSNLLKSINNYWEGVCTVKDWPGLVESTGALSGLEGVERGGDDEEEGEEEAHHKGAVDPWNSSASIIWRTVGKQKGEGQLRKWKVQDNWNMKNFETTLRDSLGSEDGTVICRGN